MISVEAGAAHFWEVATFFGAELNCFEGLGRYYCDRDAVIVVVGIVVLYCTNTSGSTLFGFWFDCHVTNCQPRKQ